MGDSNPVPHFSKLNSSLNYYSENYKHMYVAAGQAFHIVFHVLFCGYTLRPLMDLYREN